MLINHPKRAASMFLATLFIVSAIAIIVPIELANASPAEIHVYPGESIQDAIDAADPNDTIIVHAGAYPEQLYISKPLTLRAAEGENVEIMPPEAVLNTYEVTYDIPDGTKTRTFAPLIIIVEEGETASSVVIEGFIIDGNHELLNRGYQTTGDPIYVGVVYANFDGTIRNCEIRNFRPEPEQTDLFNNGFAIWVVGYSEVVIEGNYIHDYGWMGIVVDGITNGETVTIIDNTITGWGPTIQTGQNGIQVSRGAHVKILSNTITGNAYTGPDWWASGIIFFDAEGEVIGNAITDNQVGVDGMGDVTAIYINFNNIYGNTHSGQTICAGVCNEGEGSLNAMHNWWGDPEGPTVEEFPKSGDAVYGDVEFTPWLTAPLTPDPDGTGVIASSQFGRDTTLTYPESNVDVCVSGSAEVYVGTYESNPGARFMGDIGNYIDVYVPDVSDLTELEIRKYYTDDEIEALELDEHSLRLYWRSGTDWVQCSDTGVNTEENYIWARIGADTTPSLNDLTGTPFGAAGRLRPVGGVIIPVDKLSLIAPWLLLVAIIMASGALWILRKSRL